MERTIEKSGGKKRKRITGTTREEVFLGDLQQRSYIDGTIKGTIESTGKYWKEIRGNRRGQDS